MNKLATKLAVIAVGVLTFNCAFVAAQLLSSTSTWGNYPGRSDYGYGYAGVDSSGRYYGNAGGNGGYQVGGYDPSGRRFSYGGGAGYPGYGDTAFSYGQPGYGYGNRYYGYYNGAVSMRKTGCVYWLTFLLTTLLAVKVFV